ncbi:MAG: FAD-binding protein, partial [Planctomycetota bacterium]
CYNLWGGEIMTAIEPTRHLIEGIKYPVYSTNTLVIGSGAAGLNAALTLFEEGQRDVILITEHWGAGASYNAGSDKQTYYKLSLAGAEPDSPRRLAEDLFNGGCMHGDIALCEAQQSAEAFFRLTQMGVPFPHDKYGAYVGYKTDHDPWGRATSAGPRTSRIMCECLGSAVCEKGLVVLDDHEAVALLWDRNENGQKRVCGAIAINTGWIDGDTMGIVLFNAKNVILATGGPGGMYKTSVYPESQIGSMGLALAIGAEAHNLTESQFGLASIHFRWNLSGSYQQAIPRYISTDAHGRDEKEFLSPYFPDLGIQASAIFRKGYEWPFDVQKVAGYGSSLIDVLVYRETVTQGRRVFLDYGNNPGGGFGIDSLFLDLLDAEAKAYLEKCNAMQYKPIERLSAINPQAIELFRSKGIDLASERLEVAVCAQHCNGGLKGDIWWESNIRHLFPVGEVNGSHGVRRPGGAALNAGQVGSLRAARFIAKNYIGSAPEPEIFLQRTNDQIRCCLEFAKQTTERTGPETMTPLDAIQEIQVRMSGSGAHIRKPSRVDQAREEAWGLFEKINKQMIISSGDELPQAYRARDLCLTHALFLEAIYEYLEKNGKSRGSSLVLDPTGIRPSDKLGDEWRFSLTPSLSFVNRKVLEIGLDDQFRPRKQWVDIRPVPEEDGWFETVWHAYVQNKVIVREE